MGTPTKNRPGNGNGFGGGDGPLFNRNNAN